MLDKLTYAGNLANLRRCIDDPRLQFVEGDILDRALVDDLMGEVDAVVHFAAESHVDRSILGAADFVMTNVVGTQTLLDSALQHGIDEVRARVDRRGLRVDRRQAAGTRSSRSSPTRRTPPRRRPSDLLARSYFRTHELPVCVTRCSNNYGPLPVPREGHPALRHQPDRRRDGPAVRRGRQRPRLAARRRPLPRHPPGARGRPAGRGLQHRRRHRAAPTGSSPRELLAACGSGLGAASSHVEDRKGHDLRYSVAIDKISRELGYQPRSRLRAGPRRRPCSGTPRTAPGGSP